MEALAKAIKFAQPCRRIYKTLPQCRPLIILAFIVSSVTNLHPRVPSKNHGKAKTEQIAKVINSWQKIKNPGDKEAGVRSQKKSGTEMEQV